MQNKNIPIDLLINNSGQIEGVNTNPRDLTDEGFDLCVESIKSFPDMLRARELIVVPHNEYYIVIRGNQRLKALKHLEYKSAFCKVVDWSTDKINEFIIKDNIEYGKWDYQLLEKDWDTTQLLEWGLELPEFEIENPDIQHLTDADEIPELATETTVQLGDVWILDKHRLMCGDSTNSNDIATLMAGQLADLVWTDPPYNVAVNGKAGKILNDDMNHQAFSSFIAKIYHNYFNNMKQGAVIYVAHSETERTTFTQEFSKAGFKLSQVLIWVKHSATFSRQDFNWRHEPILYGWKEGEAHYFCRDFTNTTVIEDEQSNNTNYQKMSKPELITEIRKLKQQPDGSTVINHDRPTVSELHPTMKPVSLVEMMIGWSSKPEWLVLDLFGGSGSTLIACEKSNRRANIMELDPHYCDVIIKRWQNFTGKKAININTNCEYDTNA